MKWTLVGASASKIKQYSNAQKISRIFAAHQSPVSDEYPIIIDESMSLKDLAPIIQTSALSHLGGGVKLI
ncbi:hypothetical protein [Marinoscillum luteum]|uniref:hypothetical protein n=1 Tax=Marinoscillum luteum TaxID=861051 RepID=UPI0037579AC1